MSGYSLEWLADCAVSASTRSVAEIPRPGGAAGVSGGMFGGKGDDPPAVL
jgi:hypothetical protein